MSNELINFSYDPQRQGYDTNLWKTLTGVPTINLGLMIHNAASSIQYGDIYKAYVMFSCYLQTPAENQFKRIGLRHESSNTFVGFTILGDKFYAATIGNDLITNVEIPWEADWQTNGMKLGIRWHGFDAIFYVNGIERAIINGDVDLPRHPMSLYIFNDNEDTISTLYIDVKECQSYI